MLFRCVFFHPNRRREEAFSEKRFVGSQVQAEEAMRSQLQLGEASLAQLLREDGLVLCTAVPQIDTQDS